VAAGKTPEAMETPLWRGGLFGYRAALFVDPAVFRVDINPNRR
jgi:hypothetical protein